MLKTYLLLSSVDGNLSGMGAVRLNSAMCVKHLEAGNWKSVIKCA